MKVLELCLSDGVGGLELYAVRSAQRLQARGVECVAVAAGDTFFARRMLEQGTRTIHLRRRNEWFPWLAARKLARIIDDEAADIVHMHWGHDLNLAVLAKRAARRPVKLVYTRQMAITRDKHDVYHKFLYRHVDLYLAITDELAGMATRFLPMPPERIKRLYYGVESPAAMDAGRREQVQKAIGIPAGRFAVGLVGRIEAGKGQHLLIEAVARLRQAGVPVHATIVGPVMDLDYVEGLKRSVRDKTLQDVILFFGSHPNPADIMGAFDVIVLATKKETFGLVLIEAMRGGVAVIGSNAGGVPEIIEHGKTGLLFKPESAQDLSDKLLYLYEHQEQRQRLAQAGKDKADTVFTTEAHYDQLLKYLTDLTTI